MISSSKGIISAHGKGALMGIPITHLFNKAVASLKSENKAIAETIESVTLTGFNNVALIVFKAKGSLSSYEKAGQMFSPRKDVKARKIADIDGVQIAVSIKKYIGNVDVHRVKMLVDADGFYLILNDNMTGVRYAF